MKPHQSTAVMHHRRDILSCGLRCAGVLALGGVATALGWRSLGSPCSRANPCGDCPEFSGCELPKAAQAKSSASVRPAAPGAAQPSSSHHG